MEHLEKIQIFEMVKVLLYESAETGSNSEGYSIGMGLVVEKIVEVYPHESIELVV